MSLDQARPASFTLGLDAGRVGRWARLILGSVIPLYSIMKILLAQRPTVDYIMRASLYIVVVLAVYLAAHYLLGERVLARSNPWIGTLLLVGPPTLALVLSLGPPTFRLALALYISISLLFNFVMSYGGCELMAIPTLVFRKRYTVYCPWNVVDVVDKAIADRSNPTS